MTGTPAPLPVPAATLGEGPCWDSSSGSLYWVDIPAGRVHRLDGDGAFRSWDVGQAVGAGDAIPDGLAVDAEGCVWVALWDGGAVLRFGPDGRLMQTLELPTPMVSSCAFGGPDLETLYVTTAAGPGSSGGELFRLQAGVTGLASHAYQG